MRPHDANFEVAHHQSCHNLVYTMQILKVTRYPTYRKCVQTMQIHKYGKLKLHRFCTTLQLKITLCENSQKNSDEIFS